MPETTESVLDAAVQYAVELGWRLIPVSRKTKRPYLKNWPVLATDDEDQIRDWFGDSDDGIGLVLGPGSGVVDVEYDCPEGEATATRLIPEGLRTPRWAGRRGRHHLFRYTDELPRKAVLKDTERDRRYGGLEVRIGAGGLGAQSVLPPSIHPDGTVYRWEVSPFDCTIAEMPEPLLAYLCNVDAAGGNGQVEGDAKLWENIGKVDKIPEGERDSTLTSEIAMRWREKHSAWGRDGLTSEKHFTDVFAVIRGLDRSTIGLNLSVDELRKKVENGRRFVLSQVDSSVEKNYTGLGLEFDGHEWHPGNWRVESISGGEQDVYHIYAPILEEYGVEYVEVVGDHVDRPESIHSAFRQATNGKVCLVRKPREWAGIWNGQIIKGRGAVEGVKAKLLDLAEVVEVSSELRGDLIVLEYAWSHIKRRCVQLSDKIDTWFSAMDEEGTIWFRFNDLYSQSRLDRQEFTRDKLSVVLRSVGCVRRRLHGQPSRMFRADTSVQGEIKSRLAR